MRRVLATTYLLVLGMAPLLVLAALYAIEQDVAMPYLEKSIPHVGADFTSGGPDGSGVVIAVIDTGIDYKHPDLAGFGPDGKVVGGHNFVDPSQPPLDTNGHGTQVAGIIAADGVIRGVAPKAKLLAYKVSEDGDGVSPAMIVGALRMAVRDGADLINISLGVNKTNASIDAAVSDAVKQGVPVIVAAGNDGPTTNSIGSPGRNPLAITVGATYNNLTSSQVATLTVNGMPFVAIPMQDTATPSGTIEAPVIYGGHASERDLAGLDVAGAIVLAERGSNVDGELLFFSIKEHNAAEAGAAAIIIYNEKDGIFYGELIHEHISPGYAPRIPAVSMDREDGLKILEMTRDGAHAVLSLLQDPDHPAPFSSRGSVSPFYVKPDIMAPGVYINTTSLDGYSTVSGTSYATPHVTGTAALLLQLNPDMATEDIRSVLASTSSPVTGSNGMPSLLDDAGSGRLNASAALSADLAVIPPAVVASVTPHEPFNTIFLDLRPIRGTLGEVSISYDIPDAQISHSLLDDRILLHVGSDHAFEGRVEITHRDVTYEVPLLIRHTNGTLKVTEDHGQMSFEISHPDKWSFAKITVTGRDGESYRTSAIPGRPAHLEVYGNGIYYAQAEIVVGTQRSSAYATVLVDDSPHESVPPQFLPDIPWRQAAIAAAVAGVAGVVVHSIHLGRRQ